MTAVVDVLDAASRPPAHRFAEYGASNWVWLADLVQFERVLVIAGTDAHATGLRAHFGQVIRLAGMPASGISVCGTALSLPVRSASVDCVALRELLAPNGLWAIRPALHEARRVLRPGGCVVFGFDCPSWSGAFRAGGPADPGRRLSVPQVTRHVRGAGFSRLEVLYAQPSPMRPTLLIPRSRRSTGFYEMHKPTLSWKGLLRRWLARCGQHAMLYPSYLAIAYT